MSLERLTEINEQEQEGLTKYKGVIGSDHAYIHKGIGKTAIIDLGSISATTRIGFTTPSVASGKYVHWRPIGVQTSADFIKYTMTEDDSFTGGSDVTPFSRNRVSDLASVMQAFKTGVTATPAGTVVQAGGIGASGNPASQSGGGARASEELVLAQNTSYVITIVPDGATQVTAEFFWYEEDGYDPTS